jgi:hypothetical protein
MMLHKKFLVAGWLAAGGTLAAGLGNSYALDTGYYLVDSDPHRTAVKVIIALVVLTCLLALAAVFCRAADVKLNADEPWEGDDR